jgi:hypothetical protein
MAYSDTSSSKPGAPLISTLSESLAPLIRRYGAALAIFAFAFAIRAPMFGNPILDYDEQLYLVVGDGLLHGHLPYVELWDRKPIGLFLFYAGVRLLGGTGVIEYQIAATLCAALTALLIHTMARRRAGPIASLATACIYLHMLNALHGMGGQAGVLYNPITASGAWAALLATETGDRKRVARLGSAAMAAFGIAIQFKYVPIIEGVFFGCFFVWRLWSLGQSVGRIAIAMVVMILIALAPSLAAIAFYAATGHLDAFVQANFQSIFQRLPFSTFIRVGQWLTVLVMGGPLIIVALVAAIKAWRQRAVDGVASLVVLLGWPIAALAGFLMLGDFYSYYFITALPPLLVLAASAIRPNRFDFAIGCLLLIWPVLMPPNYADSRSDRLATERLVDQVRPYVQDRCLYIFDGPTVAYLLTHACIPTRFLFPDHLTNPVEARALGIDPAREEARILASKPGAIITATSSIVPRLNPATQTLVKAALARDYVLTARIPTSAQTFYVWVLRSLHPTPLAGPVPTTPY